MKRTIWIAALLGGVLACAADAGAVMDFSVDVQGGLCITRDGNTVLREEAPVLVDSGWKRVAEFAVAPERNPAENGGVATLWSDGGSTMSRRVERLPDGSFRIIRQMRFLNGVTAARHVELDCFIPGGRVAESGGSAGAAKSLTVAVGERTLKISFAGFSIPWVFEKQEKSGIRLILAWNYDPAAINRIESTMLIGEIPGKAKEEK